MNVFELKTVETIKLSDSQLWRQTFHNMKLTFKGASIIHTLMGIRIVLQKNSRKETQSQEIQSGQENARHG